MTITRDRTITMLGPHHIKKMIEQKYAPYMKRHMQSKRMDPNMQLTFDKMEVNGKIVILPPMSPIEYCFYKGSLPCAFALLLFAEDLVMNEKQLRNYAKHLAEDQFRIFDELLSLIRQMGRREAVLFQCSKFAYDEMVCDAIALGANVDATGPYGCALHAAVWENDPDMCKLLCKKGASIHVQNKNGSSPLDWCLDYYPEFAMILLENSKHEGLFQYYAKFLWCRVWISHRWSYMQDHLNWSHYIPKKYAWHQVWLYMFTTSVCILFTPLLLTATMPQMHHILSLGLLAIFFYLATKHYYAVFRPEYTIYIVFTLLVLNPLNGCFFSELRLLSGYFYSVVEYVAFGHFASLPAKTSFHQIANAILGLQTFVKTYGFFSMSGEYLLWMGFSQFFKLLKQPNKLRNLVVMFGVWQVLAVLTHMIFHRYFSHRAFATSRVFQFILACFGVLTNQRGPLWWASHHRGHHYTCEGAGDPHSPARSGFFYAHVGWTFLPQNYFVDHTKIGDFLKYDELVFLDTFSFLLLSFAFDLFDRYISPGFTMLFCMGNLWHLHWTFFTNSVSHSWNAAEGVCSPRDVWWVGALNGGEGYHISHHTNAPLARHGMKWFQIDTSYYTICFLELFGLIWNVKRPAIR